MSDERGTSRACPWCSAAASESETSCHACGAALAQRESIGDLVIPGVTTVDPGLQAYADQPMRMSRPSPSQGMASGVIAASTIGGPVALAAIGGLAAVGAAEYLGARRGDPGKHGDLAEIGRPSEAVLLAAEQLESDDPEEGPDTQSLDPWRDEPWVGHQPG